MSGRNCEVGFRQTLILAGGCAAVAAPTAFVIRSADREVNVSEPRYQALQPTLLPVRSAADDRGVGGLAPCLPEMQNKKGQGLLPALRRA